MRSLAIACCGRVFFCDNNIIPYVGSFVIPFKIVLLATMLLLEFEIRQIKKRLAAVYVMILASWEISRNKRSKRVTTLQKGTLTDPRIYLKCIWNTQRDLHCRINDSS